MECLECERLASLLRIATLDCTAANEEVEAFASNFFCSKGLLTDWTTSQWATLYERLNAARARKEGIEARYQQHRTSHPASLGRSYKGPRAAPADA